MENLRLLLVAAIALIGFELWQAWQHDYGQPAQTPAVAGAPAESAGPPDVTDHTASALPAASAVPDKAGPTSNANAREVTLTSDLLKLTVSTDGGTIQRAELLTYPVSTAAGAPPVELLGRAADRVFVHESGLTGSDDLPTHHATFLSDADNVELATSADEAVLNLKWTSKDGVEVTKRIILTRGSYVVRVEYSIDNKTDKPLNARLYEQLKRNDEPSRRGMVYTFTGPALSTPEKRFEKFKFDAIKEKPIATTADNAWIGIIQHYFVAALIPHPGAPSQFYSRVLDDKHYLVGFVSPTTAIPAGSKSDITSKTYIGPKRHDIVASVAPGLELSVDFGSLWFIAKPIFIALRTIHDFVGNWGFAIILVTLALKLLFYPLSAAGYRSMAKMRKVQPRMVALKDRYGDDRAGLNQAMMKLYKDEKINPLGGCFPIMIQIPVFIALYWVLLESVEMRQAPFILWVHDLSERDPFFVLPLLMGISMWAQQKLNPAPIDPLQAKVMQLMPIMFTVFFAFFPSGLVLYWFVNNMLSIAQQWHITRSIEASTT